MIAEGWWNPYAPELRHTMYSMSKSFTSTSVVFAVAEGRLDVDANVRVVLLEARGLTYRHPRGGRGITTVDLRLPRGTLTVVTGRVGAGKTTLLRTLLGLLPREAGEIRWNGHVVDDPASFLVPPRCAYTAQVPRLFSETLKQNILLGLPDDPAVLNVAVRGAVLEHDVQALEAGLVTLVGSGGVKLSGGQVQRTAAARRKSRSPLKAAAERACDRN